MHIYITLIMYSNSIDISPTVYKSSTVSKIIQMILIIFWQSLTNSRCQQIINSICFPTVTKLTQVTTILLPILQPNTAHITAMIWKFTWTLQVYPLRIQKYPCFATYKLVNVCLCVVTCVFQQMYLAMLLFTVYLLSSHYVLQSQMQTSTHSNHEWEYKVNQFITVYNNNII